MRLTHADDLDAEVDALAERLGGRVGLTRVLADLDRRLHRSLAPCLSPHRAWTWERTDRGDTAWWPQGIAVIPGGRHVAVSWYAKHGGSRLSFLDLRRRRYRHVDLVLPGAGGTHEPLAIHAGGLAWDPPWLYVAATRRGLWVARTDDVLRGPDGYLLPVRGRLAPEMDPGVEAFRFSFVSLDSTTSPPGLVVGEYGRGGQSRRLARFPAAGGAAQIAEAGVPRAQGVAVVGDRHCISSSNGPWGLGSLWSGRPFARPGQLRERRFALPMGPEDLHHDPTTGHLWTVTEHPHRRWIVRLAAA